MDKIVLKLIQKSTGSSMAETFLKKKKLAGSIRLPDLRTYRRALALGMVWSGQGGHTDPGDRGENPGPPHIYTHLISDKGATASQRGRCRLPTHSTAAPGHRGRMEP